MSEVRDAIQLVNIPDNTPQVHLVGGALYIDLDIDFSFSITEKASELNDINELKIDGVLGFSVPMGSRRNKWIFQDYLDPNTEDQDFSPVDVRCLTEGNRVLLQTQLFFKSAQDKEQRIELELVDSDNHWVRKALALSVRDVVVGSFVLTEANLRLNWAVPQWEDGNDLFWFPLVHYGNWIREQDFEAGHIAPEDFLPWFSLLGLVRECFFNIGWSFECPLFDVDECKRWWIYLLDENFNYDLKGDHWEMRTGMGVDQVIDTNNLSTDGLNFGSVFKDNASAVFTQTQPFPHDHTRFLNLTQLKSEWRVNLHGIVNNPNAFTIQFDITVTNYDTNNIISRVNAVRIQPGGQVIDVNLEFETDFGNNVYISITGFTGDGGVALYTFSFLSGFECTMIPISNRLYRNDDIQLNQLIGRDYIFMDLFKGLVHLIAGKVVTDWEFKTVKLFPPENTLFHGEEVEGFLRPTSENLEVSNNVVPNSRVMIAPTDENERFLRIQFAKSTDDFITKRLLVDTDEQLYSRDVDLGSGVEEKVKELKNPFFEPTGNHIWNRLELPALWGDGGDEGKRNTKVKPRVCYAVGYFAQADAQGASNRIGWEFEWNAEEEMPYLSQEATQPYDDGGVFTVPEISIVYGRSDEEDFETLFEQAWEREVRMFISTVLFEFLLNASQNLFEDMDFRQRLFFIYSGVPYILRLLEKKDYKTARKIPLIIMARPGSKLISK